MNCQMVKHIYWEDNDNFVFVFCLANCYYNNTCLLLFILCIFMSHSLLILTGMAMFFRQFFFVFVSTIMVL